MKELKNSSIMKKKIKGIWLFGLSGSGKTYISNYLKKKIKKNLIIDGDIVRKYVSTDLGYDKKSRHIQVNRVFGISKIAMLSGYFPIISTVFMNNKISKILKKEKIILVKVVRSMKNVEIKKTYKKRKNIVGKDISFPRDICFKEYYNKEGSKNCHEILKFLK